MKKVEKTANQIVFTADISDTLANSVRRYVNRVLVLAVDEVEISRNDSPLYDEAIAHRISLVPLKSDKSVNEKSSEKLKLDVKKQGYVYSGEMKGGLEVAYKNIPITTLAEGQEIQLVAFAKAGKGAEHAKFSPGLMLYRSVSEITMDKEFHEEINKVFPNAEIKEKGNKIVIVDNKKNEMLDFCEGLAERKKKKAEVETKPELVVLVESFGQMPPEDIFKKSIDALRKDLASIHKGVDKA